MLWTDEGRERFWAESAEAREGIIHFRFSNGEQLQSRVLEVVPPFRFRITYFGGGVVTFELRSDGEGGTDLKLEEVGSPPDAGSQNRAGWVSVLLMLKAAADFRVDLRSHDPLRTWEHGYVDV